MWTFLLRRLLALPPLLLVISVLTYLLLQAAPGDFYSNIEQNPKYSYHYVMELRRSVGRVVAVPATERAAQIGAFTLAGRPYAFDAAGAVQRDGRPADARVEQTWLKKFEWPAESGTFWTVDDTGATYRWVGPIHGYFVWLRNVLHGDMGKSWSQGAPVLDVMFERIGNTMILEVVALTLAWGLAIPLGVWSGVRPNSFVDHLCGAVAYMSLSVPSVFLALLALLFALQTKWFPIGNMRSTDYDTLGTLGRMKDVAWHLALPAAVIGLTEIAIYMRQMRGQMVETMSSDYVRTARAKGLSERRVQFRHALRNAINPLVTLFGFSLAATLSGSFLVEYVFNWPGLAQVTVNAIFNKDEPLVMASVLFAALILVVGNLVADVLLAIVDPKIRLE
jgi:peptide/nickel transport system permease protein